MEIFKKILPIFFWLKGYSTAKNDLVAGLTISVILIPQGIAYATIAGLPPIYGLYACLVPLVIVTIFTTARQVSFGPVAMDSLILGAGLIFFATPETSGYIEYALLVAFFVGIIQLLLGILKLGTIIRFLSRPVISGFTSASGFIIGLSQIPNLLDIKVNRNNSIHELLYSIWEHLSDVNISVAVIGLSAVVILKIIKKWNKKLPSELIVVFLGIVVMHFFKGYLNSVPIVGRIPSELPDFKIPNLQWTKIQEILPISLTLALVGFIETISISKTFELKQNKYKTIPNKELITLGLANFIGSLFQSYQTSVSFSRSTVNYNAGAKTPITGVIASFVILLVILFIPPLLYYLPKTIISAIIMVSAFKLVNKNEFKRLFKTSRIDFCMMLLTFLIALFFGIKEGVIFGVLLSLFGIIYRTSKPNISVLGRMPNSNFYRNIEGFDKIEVLPSILIIRFDSQLYFANVDYFKSEVERLAEKKGNDLKVIVIDSESIPFIDSTAVDTVREMLDYFKRRKIKLSFTSVKSPVRKIMAKSGLVKRIGPGNLFINVKNAVLFYTKGELENREKYGIYNR